MALKGDRHVIVEDPSFFMNEVAQRGGMTVYSTIGSGSALDQSVALVTMVVGASGSKPAGLLMCDMVNIDQTRQHINWHKQEIQKGGKVHLLKEGWVLTDQIASGITIAAGDLAYLEPLAANDGEGRITNSFSGETVSPTVGRFLSKKDEDGYAKVYIKIA